MYGRYFSCALLDHHCMHVDHCHSGRVGRSHNLSVETDAAYMPTMQRVNYQEQVGKGTGSIAHACMQVGMHAWAILCWSCGE